MAISHMSKEDSGIGVNGNPFTCFARSLCAPLAKKKDRRQQSDYVRIDPHATATTGDPPTDLLLYLGRSMPLKKLDYERVAGDQEVPSSVRHSDDCYSAEKNFVRELTWGNPNVIDIDGKKFVDKRYGVETALNLEPVEFRGVNVPPGFICRVSPEHDRGKKLHRVCRPSAFVFNEEVARRAFGRQLSRLGKAYVSDAFETFADLKARVL
ncbi:hypothetical protein FWD20_01200 [Candidatus Saccharibacteria bacterium]|nr:hypothetical protein [Candidatus Saccharibacteria bacterium]